MKCKVCGSEIYLDDKVYLTNPAQYCYICPNCEYRVYIYENSGLITPTISVVDDTEVEKKDMNNEFKEAFENYCKLIKKRKSPTEKFSIIHSMVKVDDAGNIIEFKFIDK